MEFSLPQRRANGVPMGSEVKKVMISVRALMQEPPTDNHMRIDYNFYG